MSISQELVNFNEVFSQLKSPPVIINDVMESSQDEKDKLKALIFTMYNSDLLSNLPSCDCGSGFENEKTGITGQYNIGVVCPNCGTAVKSQFDQTIEPVIWMRAPNGIKGLINPIVLTMLTNRFSISDFKTIRYLCDSQYKLPNKIPAIVKQLDEAGIKCGYNYFIDNFDRIIKFLFDNIKLKTSKLNTKDYLKDLLQVSRGCIFSKYLPLPNRSLLVIEETNVGTYVDPIIVGAIDAIQTIASIDSSLYQHSVKVKENRTVKTLFELSNFNDSYLKSGLAGKPGIFRKHIFGTRVNWGFRAVITSLTDKHEYDEIHIPWGVAVAAFRYHVLNKLYRMGYTTNAAISFLNQHAKKFHPLLNNIFKGLIADSPDKGIPATLGRNPSLHRSSIQKIRVTYVKEDVQINTISLSIIIIKGLGADKQFIR